MSENREKPGDALSVIPSSTGDQHTAFFPEENHTKFVFTENHQEFDPSAPGFNRVFSFFGNTVIRGKIPSNTLIAVYGGAAVVLAEDIGHDVKICTDSVADEQNEIKLDMWRKHAATAGISEKYLTGPVSGFTYANYEPHQDDQQAKKEPELIQINPLDIYIESKLWEDRSTLGKAFDGDVVGLNLTLISSGSILFNGNTPPHTVISTKVGNCYIGGTSGAVSLLNVGGKKGVRAAVLGSINTLTTFGEVITGSVHEDCTLSSNGNVTIYGKIGERSVITTMGDVYISDKFLHNMPDHEKDEILRRITTPKKIRSLEGKIILDRTQKHKLIPHDGSPS